jgi:glycosyltransferase involved in cell wall biosynthesis
MHPKITIITPTFNQGKFIERSIMSVIAQNYPNLEYIIIDGGSTDETTSIIKKHEKYISYWVSEKDNGQSDAINKGLKKATGEIINWLNSDDLLDENALFTISNYFRNSSVKVVAGYCKYIDELGAPLGNQKFRTFINRNDILSTIANTSFNQPSTYFRIDVFNRITPLNEQYHYNMDLILWLKYLCIYGMDEVQLIEENLTIISYHNDSKTIKGFERTFKEKQSAYFGLFNSFNNITSDLGFEIKSIANDKKTLFKLKKYYYRYRIFKRDLSDKRVDFSFNNLLNYLFYSLRSLF